MLDVAADLAGIRELMTVTVTTGRADIIADRCWRATART